MNLIVTINSLSRSTHQCCSVKKATVKSFAKFTGKHLCWSLSFNRVAVLKPVTLLKKRLQHRCFPVNFAKFFNNIFFTEHLRATASEYLKRNSQNCGTKNPKKH